MGENRETFPLTCYAVSGTQSEKGQLNNVIVMKMSNLHKIKVKSKDNEDDDSSDDEDEDDTQQPELETALLKHTGSINRIRVSCMGVCSLLNFISIPILDFLWQRFIV